VVVYLNQGDGTWQQRRQTPPIGTHGDHLLVADLDGDGRLDMLLGSSVLGHKRLLRLGREGGGWEVAALPQVRPGLVGAVAAADLDGDGKLDLVLGYVSFELREWHTGIDVLYRRGDGWERRTLWNEPGRAMVTAAATGDLDGDGRPDLAALTGDGRTLLFRGGPGGGFVRELSPELPDERRCRGYDVALADLDGDGSDELVEAFAGEPSPMFDPSICPDEGGLEVWKPVPAASPAKGR
jgi:hypothetical protein